MYLRVSRNRRGKNVYEYAQICERYRENGKQKTRILEYLGPVRNESDMERYRKALLLAGEKDSIRRMTPGEFSLLPSKEFGIAYASMAVMNDSGILEILRKSTSVYAHILNLMIIARLLEPSSDLSLINLSEKVYYPWSEIDLNDDNIYRTLDKLISVKDDIEIEIFRELKPDTDLIIKRVAINVDKVMKGDSTGDQRRLAERRRHIAVYNRKREELDLKDLNDKIDIVKRKISGIPDQKELKKSLGKLKSLVKFPEDGAALNEKRIGILKKLAGRFLIVTNTDLPESEIVTAYKEQWQIERSFRTIKSYLEIRPVYHRKSDRIRAHVFVCVLSLLLSRIMEKLTGRTIDSIRRSLNYLDVVPVTVEKRELYISSESSEASDVLKSLGLPYPRIRKCAHT
ncbi:MAG: transposase [Thermoplasmatales archaeon]|nr:transposase [Thermoplasmatales archaeon]